MGVEHDTASVAAAVLACLADVLERQGGNLDPDATLTSLGLESFTAVRLRRRLRDDVGLDLPLAAFLGSATVRSIAASVVTTDDRTPTPAILDASRSLASSGCDEDSFPLTPIQAAYLVGRDPAFPLGGVATFYYFEYDRVPEADPETDLASLATGWNRLVRRHPMLRMVVGADARQRVLQDVPNYAIATNDLRSLHTEKVDQELRVLREECSHQLHATDCWPLFDIRAALLPGGRTRLFVGVDVLALDLMSWIQLMREWGRFVAVPDLELPAPPITFGDLVRRRRDDPSEQRRREVDHAYWASRAPALPEGPALPWARTAAELGVPRFTRHGGELGADEWVRLREMGSGRGLSPTGLLLAAFGFVLQRWGACQSFCLNTTLFDRSDLALGDATPGLETVVGDFTSTVLVEVPAADPRSWYGFAGYAAAVNRQFWTDLDHRSVAGIEALRSAIESGQRPPMLDPATGLPVPAHPVVFTSGVGLAGPEDAPASWLGTEVFGVSQTPQVLLDHIVRDEGGELRIAWDAVDGALPPGFIEGMCAAHVRLLRRLAEDPGSWTDATLGWDPSFLPDELLPTGAFDGASPLLDEPLRHAARSAPGAPALLDATSCVDARSLASRTASTARALAGLGLGPGDLVAVAIDKGVAQVAALLGVMASGAGYVPVEPSWPQTRVASLCEQAGVRHALLAPEADASLWPPAVVTHRLDAEGVLRLAAEAEPRRPAPGDLAYVIFTSGSTGRPKGVGIEHAAARTTLDDLAQRFPLHSDDRVLALSAFSFDLSVYDIFSLLGSGGAVVLPDAGRQRDPGHWLELLARHGVTVWNTAPALLEMLVEYAEIEPDAARQALSTLRLVFLSADWIPVTLPDRLRMLAPRATVVSLGGATEASIWSICQPIGAVDPAWPSIPYGRALRGQSFHVLDADGGPCPVGEAGELFIGGDGLARGYVGDPAQTAERFIVHPVLRRRLYRTGDLGRWRHDSAIEFLGRVDRQVKVRGHRIELGEIESTLDRLPAVRQAVAQSVRGPDDRPRLVCHVVPADPAAPPNDDELIDALRASLPPFMVPNRFLLTDALPMTDNGKIDYRALPNPYPSRTPFSDTRPSPPAEASPGHHRPHQVPPDPQPRPASFGWETSPPPAPDLLGIPEAVARGLHVRLTVSAGSLAPVDALAAAADWARQARAVLAPCDVAAAERLTADGLIELSFEPPTGATGLPTPPPDSPPTTANGDVVAVAALPVPPAAAAAPSAGPDPHVERAVARVFGDLLNGPVDVTKPFFRLGASSLTVVLAHRRLRAELHETLTVVDMFAHPTVRDLATFITGRSPAAPADIPHTASHDDTSGDDGTSSGAAPGAVNRSAGRRAARARATELAR